MLQKFLDKLIYLLRSNRLSKSQTSLFNRLKVQNYITKRAEMGCVNRMFEYISRGRGVDYITVAQWEML